MNISINNLQHKISIPVAQIKYIAQIAVKSLKIKKDSLSIVFVGQTRMRRINREFLNHDYVTDVITFDSCPEAEIIICPSIAAINANQYKTSIQKEIALYVIHGILHLAGFDDHSPKDMALMRAKEQEFLSLL